MRPLTITAAIAAAAMTLLASPGATRYPSSPTRSLAAAVPAGVPGPAAQACDRQPDERNGADPEHTVSDISWFQGTLEEAFTRHTHKDHRPLFHF
jgi:hypothetical protein